MDEFLTEALEEKNTFEEKTNGSIESNDSQANGKKLSGRWTKEEHQRFVDGLKNFGKNWKKVEDYVGTRTGAQIRSHAQKFFNRLQRELNQNSETTKGQELNLNEIPQKDITTITESDANPPQIEKISPAKLQVINKEIINEVPEVVVPHPPPQLMAIHDINEEDIVEVSTNLNNMIKKIQCGESRHKKEEINSCRSFLDEYLDKICGRIEKSSKTKDDKKGVEKNINLLENLRSILMDTKRKLEQLEPERRNRAGSFYFLLGDDSFSEQLSEFPDYGPQKTSNHQPLNDYTLKNNNIHFDNETIKLHEYSIGTKKFTHNNYHFNNNCNWDEITMEDSFEEYEPMIEKKIKTVSPILQESI